MGQLTTAAILFQRGVPPDATYMFKHALLQDVAYASLLKSQRQQFHARTAQVLEQQYTETVAAHPELLAHHSTEAGLIEHALPYWQKAGQRANQRSTHVEAVGHFTTALEVLQTLPNTPARSQRELALQIALGAQLIITKGFAAPEVATVFTRARELSQQVDETAPLVGALTGLIMSHEMRGELPLAHELAE